MFTITQSFLDLFPNWAQQEGWKAGDTFDMTQYLSALSQSVKDNINAHPPHRPGG